MKVTKAKGLNTIRPVQMAADLRRLLSQPASLRHRAHVGRAFASVSLSLQQPIPAASGSSQIVFRPSSWGPFFWASRRSEGGLAYFA
jgi:hypothetical protein